MSIKKTTLLTALAIASVGSTYGQDDQPVNYIRESARFTAVGNYAADNSIDVYATDDITSTSGLSYEEFNAQLFEAWAEGRGAIINFDNPVYGDAFVDFDRSSVGIFIEEKVQEAIAMGTNFDLQTDLQAFIESSREEAIANGVVDFSKIVPIINRTDPFLDNPGINPQSETVSFDKIIAVYGNDNERQLIIERGPQSYTEGDLASFDAPAAEYLRGVNDSYFRRVSRDAYGDPVPTSLPFSLNVGMQDLVFDARDNVTALGFTMLSVGNFQYWQGLSAEPDRPDNLRVVAEFSDGSSELLTSTTRQSNGGWDVFFGIKAPSEASITRIWVRVVGRNWRTFTSMDDLAFVTEPAKPFITSETTASGSVGAPFYYRLLTGQSPDSISASGLPNGWSFDPLSGLVSGTPSASGTFPVTFTMTNEVGTSQEVVDFTISGDPDPDSVPEVTNQSDLSGGVTLGLELSPIQVETNLDAVSLPGDLNYFTIVYRINQDGSRTLTTLDATGLGMASGLFSGTPLRPDQVGTYLVEVFVTNEFGGDRAEMNLAVFPVVPVPNFDGDNATDVIWRNTDNSRVFVLESSSSYLADAPPSGMDFLSLAKDTGTAGAFVSFGDIDVNNQADLLAFTADGVQMDLLYFLEESATRNRAISELSAGWEPQLVGDLRGDGYVSVLWKHTSTYRWAVWHLVDDDLAWAGIFFNDGVDRALVLDADFTGNGVRDLLFRLDENLYELVQVELLTSNGVVSYSTESFSMPSGDWVPHIAADFSGDAIDDLLWKNTYTGEWSLWVMSGAEVPEYVKIPAATEGEEPPSPINALPGNSLFSMKPPLEVVTALDVNEDQRSDLILLDPATKDYYLLRMDGTVVVGAAVRLSGSGSPFSVVAAGDFNADKREDLLAHNIESGLVQFWYLGPDGVLDTLNLGSLSPEQTEFISKRTVSMNLSIPSGNDALSLGGLSFDVPGLGMYHDYLNDWIYFPPHGFLFMEGGRENMYLYDSALGWIWTTSSIYPIIYQLRNNYWLGYEEGTQNPRSFFNYTFGFSMTEDML